jgi:eukaryotic-like serine/threonine-protein kinase
MAVDPIGEISADDDSDFVQRAVAFDEALAAGRIPPASGAEDSGAIAEMMQVQLTIQSLERIWPRGDTTRLDEGDTPSQPGGSTVESNVPFGRFRVVRELGRGGFGVVFLAIDPELNRRVALKVPHTQALFNVDLRERFIREARAIGGLDHPNIAPLYEAGEIGPILYIASAYCEGPTLSAWIRDRPGPIPAPVAAQTVASLADAIAHAHARGILSSRFKAVEHNSS